jgi:hypothetical protein
MQYFLKVTEEMGRGLYAAYDLQPSKILFTAELLVLNCADTLKVNETDLKYYTFKYTDDQDCLVLGDGEIFNHDDSPNIGYRLIDSDGRKVMMFYTLKEIKQGDQLFIDYSADTKVTATDYKVNLIG